MCPAAGLRRKLRTQKICSSLTLGFFALQLASGGNSSRKKVLVPSNYGFLLRSWRPAEIPHQQITFVCLKLWFSGPLLASGAKSSPELCLKSKVLGSAADLRRKFLTEIFTLPLKLAFSARSWPLVEIPSQKQTFKLVCPTPQLASGGKSSLEKYVFFIYTIIFCPVASLLGKFLSKKIHSLLKHSVWVLLQLHAFSSTGVLQTS